MNISKSDSQRQRQHTLRAALLLCLVNSNLRRPNVLRQPISLSLCFSHTHTQMPTRTQSQVVAFISLCLEGITLSHIYTQDNKINSSQNTDTRKQTRRIKTVSPTERNTDRICQVSHLRKPDRHISHTQRPDTTKHCYATYSMLLLF